MLTDKQAYKQMIYENINTEIIFTVIMDFNQTNIQRFPKIEQPINNLINIIKNTGVDQIQKLDQIIAQLDVIKHIVKDDKVMEPLLKIIDLLN